MKHTISQFRMILIALTSCISWLAEAKIDCGNIDAYFDAAAHRTTDDPFRSAASYNSCGDASAQFARERMRRGGNSSDEVVELLRIYSNVTLFDDSSGQILRSKDRALPPEDLDWLRPLLLSPDAAVRGSAARTLRLSRCQHCGIVAAAGLLMPNNTTGAAYDLAALVLDEQVVDCAALYETTEQVVPASILDGYPTTGERSTPRDLLKLCVDAQSRGVDP